MAAALSASASRAEPAEIGAWVERLAGDALELRAESVRRAETAQIEELVAPPQTKRRRVVLVALSTAGLAALFAGVAFAAAHARSERPTEIGATVAPLSPPVPTEPALASITTPTLDLDLDLDLDLRPPTSTPTSTSTPTPTSTQAATSLPTRAKPPRHRPSVSCDPPSASRATAPRPTSPSAYAMTHSRGEAP